MSHQKGVSRTSREGPYSWERKKIGGYLHLGEPLGDVRCLSLRYLETEDVGQWGVNFERTDFGEGGFGGVGKGPVNGRPRQRGMPLRGFITGKSIGRGKLTCLQG